MFSLVDGVREQALADSRMTDFAKSYVLNHKSTSKSGINLNTHTVESILIGTKRS